MQPHNATKHGIRRRIEQIKSVAATFSLAIVSFGLLVAGESETPLQYDRAAIAAGEVWRIFTCHLTHWNLDHWVWDAAMFLILGAICERNNRRQLVACLLTSAVTISTVLWGFAPEVQTYRGLSGIDTAFFTLLAMRLLADAWARGDRWVLLGLSAAMLGLLAKTVFEMASGTTFFVDSAKAGFVPIPLAHLVGAAVGVVAPLVPTTSRPSLAATRC